MVVLARGGLDREDAALAVRIALALPLEGAAVQLVLVDSASLLALADPPDLAPWGGGLLRELEALLDDDETTVLVETESLALTGLDDQPLRPGVEVATRAEVTSICGLARACLVI